MDRPPHPFEILAGARAPAGLDRAGRVRLLGEAAEALLEGRLPGDRARLFLGGAIAAWLDRGGDLERDFLKVRRRGSHHTPARIWALIGDERQGEDAAIPFASLQHDEDRTP